MNLLMFISYKTIVLFRIMFRDGLYPYWYLLNLNKILYLKYIYVSYDIPTLFNWK